jgi:hypothetical protein
MKKEFGEVLSYISSMTAEWPHARHRPHGPELTRQKKRTGPPLGNGRNIIAPSRTS